MKQIFKRNLSLSLVIIFILSIIQFNAIVAFAATSSDFTITGGILTQYSGVGGDVVIPSDVKSIGDNAFKNCSSVNSIIIPNGVTNIGNYAFASCTNLTSIIIPTSVTNIGECAFAFCKYLTNVTIPNSITSIGNQAFSGTLWLNNYFNDFVIVGNGILIACKENQPSITIPDSVKSINTGAFNDNNAVTSIIIPNGVTDIGGRAFITCKSLRKITIPNSVTSIGSNVFSSSTSITIYGEPNSYAETYAKANNITFSYESQGAELPITTGGFTTAGSVLTKYYGTDKVVVVPDSVASIGVGAFSGSYSLTNVTIPNSVTSIGDKAFYYCDKLTSITISSSVTSIGANAFDGCNSLVNVTIPNGVTSIGDSAFADCTKLTSITIPSSVTSIGSKAFFYTSSSLMIYGKSNSCAETYAKTYNIPFKNSDENPINTVPTPSKTYMKIRLAGTNRIETALKIAAEYNNSTVNNIILATSYNFPDALAGSVLANKLSAPILLVGGNTENDDVYAYIKNHLTKDGKVYILGGEGTVSSEVVYTLNSLGYTDIVRLSGSDRIDTSVKIENQLSVASGTPIIIATANDFPDALSISAIAAQKGYPILLTNVESLSQNVITTLQTVKPSEIIIVGGAGAVSTDVENQLKGYSTTVTRLAGNDRYETSMNIVNHFKIDTTTAVVATGDNFPDALAGSTIAAKNNAPIFLVNSFKTGAIEAYLSASKITRIYVLGGTGAVDDSVVSKVAY